MDERTDRELNVIGPYGPFGLSHIGRQGKSVYSKLTLFSAPQVEQLQSTSQSRDAEWQRRLEDKEADRARLEENLRLVGLKVERKCKQIEGLLKSQESLKELMPKIERNEQVRKSMAK